MARRKQKWRVGDVFAVPTNSNQFSFGQIIGHEPELMKSVTVALFDELIDSLDSVHGQEICNTHNLYSILFVTLNHIESGNWPIVDHRTINIDAKTNPYESKRNTGFIGAKVIGSGIVNDFVNAYFGLAPWDDWMDPDYLDSLLISPTSKPIDRIIFKS